MATGAIAGLVGALLLCAVAGAPWYGWLFAIIGGPVIGAVAIGMVSE